MELTYGRRKQDTVLSPGIFEPERIPMSLTAQFRQSRYLVLEFSVLRINAATLSCSSFRAASWA